MKFKAFLSYYFKLDYCYTKLKTLILLFKPKGMTYLDTQIEFTKCVLYKSDNLEEIVKEGQWFTIKCKQLFDSSVFKTVVKEAKIDDLIGFKAETDCFTNIRLKMGYYNSQISRVLHKAISQMRLNELSRISFELDPEILDESFKNKKDVRQKEKIYLDINFEINLIEIEAFNENYVDQSLVFNLNEHQLFEISSEHKKDANDLYQKNLFLTAFQRYHKSIAYLIIAEQVYNGKEIEKKTCDGLKTIDEINEKNSLEESQDNFKNKLFELKSQIYCNLAACQMKSENYNMVIINCTKCLEISHKKNVKALFRRAQAYTFMNDWDYAIADLKLALSVDPSNEELKQNLLKAESLKKKVQSNSVK